VIQVLISFLDLLGVLLLGLVAALVAISSESSVSASGGIGALLGLIPKSENLVIFLALTAALVLILKSVLGLVLTRKTFQFLANRQALVSGSIAERLLHRPLVEVQARSSQEISIGLTSGVSALTLTTLGQSVVIVAEIALVTILFAGLIFVDPLVAVFTVVFFGALVILLQFLLGSWATQLGKRSTDADIASMSTMQQALRAYREITVSGRRGLFIERFQSLRWDAAKVLSDTFILNQIGKYVFEVGLIVGAGCIALLVTFTKDIQAGIALLTVFLAVSARVFPSLMRMQAALSNIRTAHGAATVTLDLLDTLNQSEASASSALLSRTQAASLSKAAHDGFVGFIPSVSVSSVSVSYPSASRFALDSVTLNISPNQSIALVGATGAGKSTLADVILGVLLPDLGSVAISGVPPLEAVRKWPGALSYVPQDVAVLSGTARENVALGLPGEFIDDALVWEALERAHLADFLKSARTGLDTVVGENGVQLSGGQRQRLGIARALYSRPRLLVLDEATSALDSETEQLITDTLESLTGDVTLIIIAHRLATVRHCDQVVFLAEGRITGSGTFNEVRERVPEFDRQAKLLGL
jgi:ABC-type multidrug transport system fused ATPase/permease subunit